MAELLSVVLLLGVAAGFVFIAILLGRYQKRRQESRDELWFRHRQHMTALCASSPGAELASVVQVYQRARRGTKAVIVWQKTGVSQDSWFQNMSPTPGDLLLLRGSSGWGPHNHNPNVFYVMPGQVLSAMSPSAQEAAARHWHRMTSTGTA
ncbi:hypothetical protein [Lentzea sp. NPDC004782]|uniref:hypothetical protein n=1 Tax=Lentzea sp. NPDC004782 TaxID=3154458 RepID=UPI0033B7A3AD